MTPALLQGEPLTAARLQDLTSAYGQGGTALYLRISQDRMGLEIGVTRQRHDGRELAARRDLGEPVEYSDNDLSALKGRHRPGYAALVDAIRAGLVKFVIVFHQSRIWRNRRERAEGIELFQRYGVTLICVRGSDIDFATASGRMWAGVMGEFDTGESELKAERNQAAASDRARQGQDNGGRVLYGYTRPIVGMRIVKDADGNEIERPIYAPEILKNDAEADNVRAWFEAFLSGRKVSALARSAGVNTRTMRDRLSNLAYAGVRVNNGAEYPATWPEIVKRSTVEAARSLLADPKRRTTGGSTERKYLGSGTYQCERCTGRTVYTSGSGKGNGSRTVYRCRPERGGCGRQWDRERIDAIVYAAVEHRLGRSDLADLLPVDRPELDALNREAQGIRERLRRLAADFVTLGLDTTQVAEANRAGKARLAAIENELARSYRGHLVGSLVAAEDPVRLWREAATVDVRQAILRAVMTVTLTAAPRGKPPADWQASVDWYAQSVQIGPPVT